MNARAERIAELAKKLEHFHIKARDAEPGNEERLVYAGIANEAARELVLVLAAIHSTKKGA